MAVAMEAWAELEIWEAASMGPMAIFVIPSILAVEEAQTLVLEAMVEERCGLPHRRCSLMGRSWLTGGMDQLVPVVPEGAVEAVSDWTSAP